MAGKTIANLLVVIGANAKGFEKALTQTEKNLKKFGRSASAAGATLTKAITLPIVAVAGASLRAYADFEKSMVASTAIMGNLSDEMREKMEKTAREVAKTTRFSATQAAESYFYLASAGMDAEQSIAALPKVAAFAQAGNFDMALATDLLTDAQSALGMTIRDDVVKNMGNMTRVSDVLVKANTLANATVQQFSESLTNKAGAALRLVNKDVEEGVAVLAVFADQGLKGAAAGEALSIVMRDLQRASIKNRDQFKKFGVEVFDSNGNLNNMAKIIGDLEGALKGMSDEQVRTTLMMMGFQDKSVANIMALLGTSDAIAQYEAELRKAGGTTEEVAKKQLGNLWDQLGLVKARLDDASLTLGKSLAPVIKDTVLPLIDQLIGKVEKAAEKFAAMDAEEQANLLTKIGYAVAFPVALNALGSLAFALTAIINLFKTLGGAKLLGAVSAFFGISTAGAFGLAAVLAGVAYSALKINEAMTAGKTFNPETGMYDDKAWGHAAFGTAGTDLQLLRDEKIRGQIPQKTTSITGGGGGHYLEFAGGGAVPGPIGAPVPAIVHGGERVLTPSQQNSGITININGPISSEKDADYYANYMIKKLHLAGVMP